MKPDHRTFPETVRFHLENATPPFRFQEKQREKSGEASSPRKDCNRKKSSHTFTSVNSRFHQSIGSSTGEGLIAGWGEGPPSRATARQSSLGRRLVERIEAQAFVFPIPYLPARPIFNEQIERNPTIHGEEIQNPNSPVSPSLKNRVSFSYTVHVGC